MAGITVFVYGSLMLFIHFGLSTSHLRRLAETEFPSNYEPRDIKHYRDGHKYEFDHESVLGSHTAAEEFGQLSPEESKMRLRILALKMDHNQDGYVERTEMTDWVMRSFKMLTEEEALDQLDDEDGDNDGKVTWPEHAAETYGIYDDDTVDDEEKKATDDYKMLESDKELFEAADRNKDGALDKTEFPSFSHPEEFEHMHEIIYQQAMRKHDKNKDGFLSFREFVTDNSGEQPKPTSEQYILERDRFEHDFDQNKDGKLNREELLLWLIPNNLDMAQNEADHLISSADQDKDGKLAIEEIVSNHDVFVGSEATDFGEHLQNTRRFRDEL